MSKEKITITLEHYRALLMRISELESIVEPLNVKQILKEARDEFVHECGPERGETPNV